MLKYIMLNSKKCVKIASYNKGGMLMAFTISGFSDEIDENIDLQFQTLNDLKIGYFEPRGINGKNISTLNDDEVKTLVGKMKEYNIKASSIGSPIGKIGIEDDFEAHLELLKRVCDIAHSLEVGFIRIFSFYIPDGQQEKYRDRVLEQMVRMTECARAEGIILLHENEKGIYGDIPERCLDVLKSVDSPSLRAVFDPANFVQCGVESVSKAFDMLKDFVVYMHIKDSDRNNVVVPAGEGAGEVEAVLKKLKASGYNGFLSLEPHLGTFAGLRALEKSDDMMKLEKASAKTFALAYNTLINILERI